MGFLCSEHRKEADHLKTLNLGMLYANRNIFSEAALLLRKIFQGLVNHEEQSNLNFEKLITQCTLVGLEANVFLFSVREGRGFETVIVWIIVDQIAKKVSHQIFANWS